MPVFTEVSTLSQSPLAWASATTWDLGAVPNSPAAYVEITYEATPVDIAAGQVYTVGTVDAPGYLDIEGALTADDIIYIRQRAGSISLIGGTVSTPLLENEGAIVSFAGTVNGSVADYGQILAYGSLLINGNVTQSGFITVGFTSTLELAGTDSATLNLTTGSVLQLDDVAGVTGEIDIGPASAVSATQTTPPSSASTIVLEGISPSSITKMSYAADSSSSGALTIQEGATTQTLRFFGSLAQGSFALADASTGTSPALCIRGE